MHSKKIVDEKIYYNFNLTPAAFIKLDLLLHLRKVYNIFKLKLTFELRKKYK